jgi:hypothetical protein
LEIESGLSQRYAAVAARRFDHGAARSLVATAWGEPA